MNLPRHPLTGCHWKCDVELSTFRQPVLLLDSSDFWQSRSSTDLKAVSLPYRDYTEDICSVFT